MPDPATVLGSPRRGLRDEDIGIHGFVTNTPPLEGRLKVRIEDFLVDEVAATPEEDPQGRFTAARIRLTNWETNAFVREASARLGRSRQTVRFSGTKDKRGVTEQWFTFESPPEGVADLARLGGVEILQTVRTRREVELGEHSANRFRVVLRRIPHASEAAEDCARATWTRLREEGGAPNFFGPQRFGSRRATTHKVGERILRGDFLGACMVYLTEPAPVEDPVLASARAELARSRDWKTALARFDGDVAFERALLHRLVETNGDGLAALQALPRNLQRMFVSAYQSWLFNQILSRRLSQGLPPSRPLVGDLVAAVEAGRMSEDWVPVTKRNRDRVAREVRNGRAAITAALPGTEVPLADGPMGRIEQAVLAEQNLAPRDFLVPEQLEWSSKGTRRSLLLPLAAMAWKAEPDELHPGTTKVAFEFELPPGAYATSVLREFSKSPWLSDYT